MALPVALWRLLHVRADASEPLAFLALAAATDDTAPPLPVTPLAALAGLSVPAGVEKGDTGDC
jgi:hypothetical protein